MSIRLLHGDCLAMLPTLEADSVHACVTDPPYHLTSIVKRFGGQNAAPAKHGTDGAFARASRGFMGKQWDGGDIASRPETWAAVLRVLKPGAHLVAFGGTRTWHRMAVAIEDAGFEIRDNLAWVYGTGMPKAGGLKPGFEPIVLARKALVGTRIRNVAEYGTGALNIAACMIGSEVRTAAYTSLAPCSGNRLGEAGTAEARRGTQSDPKEYVGRWPANVVHDGSDEVEAAFAEFGEKTSPGVFSDNPAAARCEITPFTANPAPLVTLQIATATPAPPAGFSSAQKPMHPTVQVQATQPSSPRTSCAGSSNSSPRQAAPCSIRSQALVQPA